MPKGVGVQLPPRALMSAYLGINKLKKIVITIIVLLSLGICGCSLPSSVGQKYLYSISRLEKRQDGGMFGKKKYIEIKDFRGRERYEEDIALLKEDVEKYIAGRLDLSDQTKAALRELKVAEGLKAEEVKLLLGRPDTIMKDVWIYRISKWRAFTVFIIPVFFVHEGYYLYFQDGVLQGIERHYLQQVIHQGPAGGVYEKKKSSS